MSTSDQHSPDNALSSQSQPQSHDITSPTPVISPAGPHTDGLYHPSAEYAQGTNFFNPDAYFDAIGPHASGSRNHSYDSSAYDFSSMGSVPSTSHSSSHGFGGGEGSGGAFYGYNPSSTSTFAFGLPGRSEEDLTPPAPSGQVDDERTPVVSDTQRPIPPSQLPSALAQSSSQSSQSAQPLLSPFRSFGQHQHQPSFSHAPNMAINNFQNFMDPSQYYHPQMHPPNFSMQPQLAYPPPHAMHQHGQYLMGHPGVYYPPAGPQPDFYLARPRHDSAGESSMASSLVRTGSTSSDFRSIRVKVKLTKEDKRNIVELAKANTNLRQEDIARQYGVDRSTISKIILSAPRWLATTETAVPAAPVIETAPIPRLPKTVGGRFPAVEEKMSEWMDQMLAIGGDCRDVTSREQAKKIALEVGLGDRFKASAKWLDKFKDRRKTAGKTNPTHQQSALGYIPYRIDTTPLPGALSAPLSAPADFGHLSRSQSAVTLSSSGSSSQEPFVPSPACIPADRMVLNRSEPGFVPFPPVAPTATPSSTARARSQSSPHNPDTFSMMISPSSGKSVRPSPLNLQRQNSYHGSSPSPRRPAPPSRANSSQGPLRRSRPGSLAASAFGITPLDGDGPYSPTQSPTISAAGSSGSHSRQRSEGLTLTPFTSSMATMALSPEIPESGDLIHSSSTSSVASMPPQLPIPHTPITPITPSHASAHAAGIFPNLTPDFSEPGEAHQHQHQQQFQQYQHHQQLQQQQQAVYDPSQISPRGQTHFSQPQQPMSAGHAPLQGYASMPNKHYGQMGSYPGYEAGEFGQAYGGQAYGGQAEAGQGYPGGQQPGWS